MVVNPIRRLPSIWIEKARYSAFDFNTTTMATSNQFNVFFDPAGAQSYISPNPATGTGTLTVSGIPEWSAYAGLYDQYKVTKIVLNFWLAQVPTTPFVLPMLIRHNYNPSFSPVAGNMYQLPNAKMHTFSPEHQTFQCVVYPRVQDLVRNQTNVTTGTALPTVSERVSKMPWCDVDVPVWLLGASIALPNGPVANLQLVMDISYHIGFKYSN